MDMTNETMHNTGKARIKALKFVWSSYPLSAKRRFVCLYIFHLSWDLTTFQITWNVLKWVRFIRINNKFHQLTINGYRGSNRDNTVSKKGKSYSFFIFFPKSWNPKATLLGLLLLFGSNGLINRDLLILWLKSSHQHNLY